MAVPGRGQGKRCQVTALQKGILMQHWPHSPVHKLHESGTYMLTAGTYRKEKFFEGPDRLHMLQDLLLKMAQEFDWRLQAWAVLAHHYHFLAISSQDPGSLKAFVSKLHAVSARTINRLDGTPGRRIWFEYWDTHITFERSFLARLNYVQNNPVHHGLVKRATEYAYCSAAWFQRTADKAFCQTVASIEMDSVNVIDDF